MATAPSAFTRVHGAPILGSLLPISRDALAFFTHMFEQHGDRVELRVPGRSILLLCHPQDIEHVLVRDRDFFGRSAEIRKLRPIFGDGLLASEGDLWRRQRALIQPSFQHDALARYAAIMLSTIRAHTAQWQDGESRDIHADMMRYTRDVICTVLFGESFLAGQSSLGAAVSTVFGGLRSEVLYLPIWRRLPLKRSRAWQHAVRLLNHAVRTTIAERRQSGGQHADFLNALMEARGPQGECMSDRQIHDEILTFFLAGHETAALALTWTAYLLATHPQVQQHIADELHACSPAGDIEARDLPQLRWTTAAVKEAMRLYPPLWSMGREALVDTSLDGHSIARGTDIWICIHRLHHDPRWRRDPEDFRPERWMPESGMEDALPRPYTYLPFGIGPRVCIGQHFAMTEAVLGIASILSRFRLHRNDSAAAKPSAWITLRPQTLILLSLRRACCRRRVAPHTRSGD